MASLLLSKDPPFSPPHAPSLPPSFSPPSLFSFLLPMPPSLSVPYELILLFLETDASFSETALANKLDNHIG